MGPVPLHPTKSLRTRIASKTVPGLAASGAQFSQIVPVFAYTSETSARCFRAISRARSPKPYFSRPRITMVFVGAQTAPRQ